jgi:hypothetical protein
MMIRFVKNEMTLKLTLLLCDPIVTINTLVSCGTSPKKRFQTSITLTTISVTFSTNAKLCCRTNSLSMKHADSPKLKSVWVCIVVDSSPLIVMGNKIQGVGFENKGRPFLMHDALRSNLTVPIEIKCSHFPSLLALGQW